MPVKNTCILLKPIFLTFVVLLAVYFTTNGWGVDGQTTATQIYKRVCDDKFRTFIEQKCSEMGNHSSQPGEQNRIQCVWCSRELDQLLHPAERSDTEVTTLASSWTFTSRYRLQMSAMVYNGKSLYDLQQGRGDYYRLYGQYCSRSGQGIVAWSKFKWEFDFGELNDGTFYICPNCLQQQLIRQPYSKNVAYDLVLNNGSEPENAVRFGNEKDGGGVHCLAVAHTAYGNIPGKARNGNCWYVLLSSDKNSATELTTTKFSWIVDNGNKLALCYHENVNSLYTNYNPDNVLTASSNQTQQLYSCTVPEGEFTAATGLASGHYFSAVACTGQHGFVPGYCRGNRCWYSYQSDVFTTGSFFLVVTDLKCNASTEEEVIGSRSTVNNNQIKTNSRQNNSDTTQEISSSKQNPQPRVNVRQVPRPLVLATPSWNQEDVLMFEWPSNSKGQGDEPKAIAACEAAEPRRKCRDVIRLWNDSSVDGTPKKYVIDGNCVLEVGQSYNSYEHNWKRFTVITVQLQPQRQQPDEATVACSHVETGLQFGRNVIQRALLESLRSTQDGDYGLRTRLMRCSCPPNTAGTTPVSGLF